MENPSNMTLLQAIAVCDEVTPSPATAHEALKRLSYALAEAWCLPRSALKAYAADLEAASIENMPADNEFLIARAEDDKYLALTALPAGLSPLQLGLLGKLVTFYERTPFTLQILADDLHSGHLEQLRSALVGLQTAGYIRYCEDDNTLLVRSKL